MTTKPLIDSLNLELILSYFGYEIISVNKNYGILRNSISSDSIHLVWYVYFLKETDSYALLNSSLQPITHESLYFSLTNRTSYKDINYELVQMQKHESIQFPPFNLNTSQEIVFKILNYSKKIPAELSSTQTTLFNFFTSQLKESKLYFQNNSLLFCLYNIDLKFSNHLSYSTTPSNYLNENANSFLAIDINKQTDHITISANAHHLYTHYSQLNTIPINADYLLFHYKSDFSLFEQLKAKQYANLKSITLLSSNSNQEIEYIPILQLYSQYLNSLSPTFSIAVLNTNEFETSLCITIKSQMLELKLQQLIINLTACIYKPITKGVNHNELVNNQHYSHKLLSSRFRLKPELIKLDRRGASPQVTVTLNSNAYDIYTLMDFLFDVDNLQLPIKTIFLNK